MGLEPSQSNVDVQDSSVVDGEILVLRELQVTDPVVLEMVQEGDDAEATVLQLLGIGARSAKLTRASIDVQFLQSTCNELLGDFERAVAARFDGEQSTVPQTLDRFREKLEVLLGDAFDPDSKRSIIGKFDTLLREIRNEDRERIGQLLDATDERSPLCRLRRELTEAAHRDAKELREMIAHVQEALSVRSVERNLLEKISVKGALFEVALHDAVCALVAPYGDLAEPTGNITGITGGKVGDELVTLNEEDTRGLHGAYALEAKTGRLDLRQTLAQLDAAMENRGATAAIAVFSRALNAPTRVPFFATGNKAIVVFDEDERDSGPLRLATMWARWIVRRKLTEDERELNVTEVAELVEEAGRALQRHATIKTCHSIARKKIEEASRHVHELVDDVEQAMERLRRAIAATPPA